MKRFFLAIVGLAIVGTGIFGWYRLSLRPVDASSDRNEVVKIPEGSSLKAIAKMLEEEDLIRSSRVFVRYAKSVG
ncbi:aminodeoxychorismate lyase, partial [Candidatus Peregrinibacteria bacterium]|nr:aminodeoxychorismate lyase [Candidatus Peregrinibacteria bacterium]